MKSRILRNPGPSKRLSVFVDFGGPLASEREIELARQNHSLEAAKNSQLWTWLKSVLAARSPRAGPTITDISPQEFATNYHVAKRILKNRFPQRRHDDVARTVQTIIYILSRRNPNAVSQANIEQIIANIPVSVRKGFFRYLAPRVLADSSRAMNPKVIQALFASLRHGRESGYKSGFDLVSDNVPEIYKGAFQRLVSNAFKESAKNTAGLKSPKYRRKPKSAVWRRLASLVRPSSKSNAYVSGEGWGDKRKPETWKGIFEDKKLLVGKSIRRGDKVFFVDDSLEKLHGFFEGAVSNGIKEPYPILLDSKKERPLNFTRGAGFSPLVIHDMNQLPFLMQKILKGRAK